MKLMTYNILDGGADRLDLIISVIRKESPDVLVINEANNFSANDEEILKQVSRETNMSHYVIAPTEWGYDVAVFSKTPFIKSTILMPNRRAAVSVQVDSEFGSISIIGAHLSPDLEDIRVSEMETLRNSQKDSVNRIIMGDMNALSRQDNYGAKIISGFNEKQLQKFTDNGKPHFEVIDTALEAGYHDVAVYLNQNKETTVPTPSNTDIAHANIRLDYVLLSQSLLPHLVDYKVIKNESTDKGSDHYPVVITLK